MDSKSNETKSSLSPSNGTPKKKKRCRVRNRPRNKCNRKPEIHDIGTKTKLSEKASVSNGNSEQNFIKTKENTVSKTKYKPTNMQPENVNITLATREKTREEIMAEREAKKLAKQAKKSKSKAPIDTANDVEKNSPQAATDSKVVATEDLTSDVKNNDVTEKPRDQIKSEREARKRAKQTTKITKGNKDDSSIGIVTEQLANLHITSNENTIAPTSNTTDQDIKKKPVLTKAERRALQESQRAAKAQAVAKKNPAKTNTAVPNTQKTVSTVVNSADKTKSVSPVKSSPVALKSKECKVKLFNHLESSQKNVNLFVNNAQIHPSIARLGEQYAKRTVVGSNARCIAFMNALKMVIQDFETPPKKEFARSLEAVVKISVDHLQKCRPLAVSVSNAYKHIKHVLTQLSTDSPESELKEQLCHFIDTYIENQIGKAAQAISSSMQEKINNGDVILTFGCSSLINFICEEAQKRKVDFRVIVVDSRPFCEGQELLRRLTAKEIPCTYVLINAIGFVMPEVTKVLLGAHALLSNGYVMARTGTAQVALVANSFNVPVLVCCETHKFSERFQTDAIVYNELGDPHDLVLNEKCCLTNWQSKNKMSPLNLIYDITPPELVTAVVTEVSVLPCTSVPVILRIKPTEIGYYN